MRVVTTESGVRDALTRPEPFFMNSRRSSKSFLLSLRRALSGLTQRPPCRSGGTGAQESHPSLRARDGIAPRRTGGSAPGGAYSGGSGGVQLPARALFASVYDVFDRLNR